MQTIVQMSYMHKAGTGGRPLVREGQRCLHTAAVDGSRSCAGHDGSRSFLTLLLDLVRLGPPEGSLSHLTRLEDRALLHKTVEELCPFRGPCWPC